MNFKKKLHFFSHAKNLLKKDKNILFLAASLKEQNVTKNTISSVKQSLSSLFISADLKYFVRSGRINYSVKPQTERSKFFWAWKMLFESISLIKKKIMYKLLDELQNMNVSRRLKEKKIELIREARLNYKYKRPYIKSKKLNKLKLKRKKRAKTKQYAKIFRFIKNRKITLFSRRKPKRHPFHLLKFFRVKKKYQYEYNKRINRLAYLQSDNEHLQHFKNNKHLYYREQAKALEVLDNRFSISDKLSRFRPYKYIYSWSGNKKDPDHVNFIPQFDNLFSLFTNRLTTKKIAPIRYKEYHSDRYTESLRIVYDPYFSKNRNNRYKRQRFKRTYKYKNTYEKHF